MNQPLQHNDALIELLSLRLFPHKLTIQAKAELLEGAKRDAAMVYIEEIKSYEAELRELSEDTIRTLVADEKESDKELAKEQAEEEENNRFFYQRSARADYIEWTQRETWSLDDATALLFGKDPDIVNWNSVNPLVYKSKFAKRYGDLRQQLKAARESGDLHASQIPAAYLHYAKSTGFALPAELEVLLVPIEDRRKKEPEPEAAPPEISDGVSEFQRLLEQNRQKLVEKKPEVPVAASDSETIMAMRQEKETLLKMLGAMAIGRYGLEPESDDMSVTETIVDDFRKGGLAVSLASAHKLLNDAARRIKV